MSRLKLKRYTGLLRFTKAAEMDGFWHISEGPVESDRTLCGIAHEGIGAARYGADTFKSKHGNTITCPHCIATIKMCRTL